jgi:hypothetical protein
MNLQSLKGLLLGAGAVTLLGTPLPAPAQTTAASPSQTSSGIPVYQPPLRGTTAGGRIGGGTRGTGEQTVTMSVLAPEHPGLTVTPQPRLYWYLSDTIDVPAEITVVDRRSTDPLLEVSVAAPVRAGIHALDLGQQGVRLEPGVRYEWFVALIVDENQRSNDIVAGGEIELVAPAADLAGRVSAAGEAGGAAVYAGAGVWYDAVNAVSMQVAQSPADAVAREQRAALMDQVGLEHVAAYDRARKP